MIAVYSGQLYPKKKAAGSIGGAVNGGTIILRNSTAVVLIYAIKSFA